MLVICFFGPAAYLTEKTRSSIEIYVVLHVNCNFTFVILYPNP